MFLCVMDGQRRGSKNRSGSLGEASRRSEVVGRYGPDIEEIWHVRPSAVALFRVLLFYMLGVVVAHFNAVIIMCTCNK